MIEVKIAGKERAIPMNWGEIPPGSLHFVATTLVENTDFIKARVKILRRLLNISKVLFYALDDEQVNDLIELLSWMDLSTNTRLIFKEFKIKNKKYRLPDHDFDMGTAFQYALADDYYRKFHETRTDTYMHYMISTLLYEKEPLVSKEKIEERASIFWRLGAVEKVVIMAYFGAIKNMIYEKFKSYLFSSNEDGQQGTGIDFGWFGRYMDIAESGVFGDLQGVYRSRFYDIVVFLIQKKEAYEATLRESKKMENG